MEKLQCWGDQKSERVKGDVANDPPNDDQGKDRYDDAIASCELGIVLNKKRRKNDWKNHGITSKCGPEISMQNRIECPSKSAARTVKMRNLIKNTFRKELTFTWFVEIDPYGKSTKKEKDRQFQKAFYFRIHIRKHFLFAPAATSYTRYKKLEFGE